MADVKPAEVSAILREQLAGFRSEAELQEVCTVLQIGDGIARVYGLKGVQYGELVEFEGALQGIALNLEEDNVGVVLLGRSSGVKEGDEIIAAPYSAIAKELKDGDVVSKVDKSELFAVPKK